MNEMKPIDIPVFADRKPEVRTKKRIQPAEILNPRRPNTWALTPKGQFGDETCAYLIDLFQKRGVNAIILTEDGTLDFGVVVRHES